MSLPFTLAEFLQVFAAYNTAIWPMQVAAAVLGAVAIVLLFLRHAWADRSISAILFLFWGGMAIGYHWTYFSTINDAAYLFGGLFLLAAVIFLVEGVIRGRVHYTAAADARGLLAAALIVYSFVVYPLVGLFATHPYPETPLFGVAPCPTTIFSLGFLVIAQHPKPVLLAAIPLLWSLVGGSAAFLLGVFQDLGLLAAAALWLAIVAIRPSRTASI
jgi:hypothetical protein